VCTTCGCGEDGIRVTTLHDPSSRQRAVGDGHTHDGLDAHVHAHDGSQPHSHQHGHDHEGGHEHRAVPASEGSMRTIEIEQQVLAKNDALAALNRRWLSGRGIRALNVMSSPGSGKTSLLVKTIQELGAERPVAVIEGDQETLLDAERIRATGCEVVQINTGAGCHLDADMLHQGLEALDPPPGSLLFIENVGNLVCPALFDLGEAAKVVVISVTEGDDKPLKYPHMFAGADLVVINKTDLLPYVDFDVDACSARARSVNPGLEVMALSVKSGAGLESWYGWCTSPAQTVLDA
jgi:hydrogenase nickel incorporation protein HypB